MNLFYVALCLVKPMFKKIRIKSIHMIETCLMKIKRKKQLNQINQIMHVLKYGPVAAECYAKRTEEDVPKWISNTNTTKCSHPDAGVC